ncbi:DUF3995 domain-containing protein [Arcobacter sp. LA11]|uniref:DUF3995 domain-containing protein n=1 Tax=Arcobacter sp. LA11 TaxID=1898176 RepID=UPI000932B4D6|nr:DUF3995 domain-containing protein [Arcobacter sp. LA11]
MITGLFTFYIFIIMSLITKIHIYWFKGGLWPAINKQDFIDKVLGRGDDVPGTVAYIFVIVCFALMALFPVIVYYNIDMGIKPFEKYIFLILAIIFLLRAISMFIPKIAQKATKIFLEYNKKYYAPLCFSLSISYLILFYIHN